jgi:integrase
MAGKPSVTTPYSQSKFIKAAADGVPGLVALGSGLYFRITDEGTAFWFFRFTSPETGKRRNMRIAPVKVKKEGLTYPQAQDKAAELRTLVREGIDPINEKKRKSRGSIIGNTVDDLANHYLARCRARIKNPQIPERHYRDEVKPIIGDYAFANVTPPDLVVVLDAVKKRKAETYGQRPAVTNDVLFFLRNLFDHAIKMGYLQANPAATLTTKDDGGGPESRRKRALSEDEVKIVFHVFKENIRSFGWENYIACALLLCIGCRKSELTGLPWHELDREKWEWTLPEKPNDPGRNKSEREITMPISPRIRHWFEYLRFSSMGSDYVFPTRRISKRSKNPFMSESTLNRAVDTLFGISNGKNVENQPRARENVMAKAGVTQHFTIHDLRRTFRTFMSKLDVAPHISERCLNHSLEGIVENYDVYDWLPQRTEAMNNLADYVLSLIGEEPKLQI